MTGWGDNEAGNLVAEVRWGQTPGVEFTLELTADGRILEWKARAEENASLSARRLRAAPIVAMERAIRAEVARMLDQSKTFTRDKGQKAFFNPDGSMTARPLTDDEWAAVERSRHRHDAWARQFLGRPASPDRKDLAVAVAYVNALKRGEPRPVKAVAEEMTMAEKTVRNYLFKAREQGLLTSLGQGKAGGELTDKAKEILDGDR